MVIFVPLELLYLCRAGSRLYHLESEGTDAQCLRQGGEEEGAHQEPRLPVSSFFAFCSLLLYAPSLLLSAVILAPCFTPCSLLYSLLLATYHLLPAPPAGIPSCRENTRSAQETSQTWPRCRSHWSVDTFRHEQRSGQLTDIWF